MEVRELQWFLALAKSQSMTNTATELHISQPTLSRALGRVERKLGVKLFDRNQNRLRLNKYGEIFQSHVIKAIKELEDCEEEIRTLVDPESGVVSLGFLHSFGGWLIPTLMDRYRAKAPNTTFELEGGPANTIVEAVRSGRIDIGFVAPEPTTDDLVWVPLGKERLCLEVPETDEWADRTEVSIAEIAERPMVALGTEYGLRQTVDRLFEAAGLKPQITMEATELSTLRALVRHSAGIAIVPVAPDEHLIPTRRIVISDPGAFRPYGAVVRRSGPHGNAARQVLRFVAETSDFGAGRDPGTATPRTLSKAV
ncbi:LysR family transcriptional regulator [Gordonia amarae]|uniref:LysR family transcriptional regulator n=2 Tax=Gordonia amarae TaxID=36821 RepID=A0A857LSJ9_9ACTN|nr:LysR family transcriptional regulator [Gordonia amarae]QHN19440.1 LysR family transcriptional regulator [Gordonia amarae]QHN23916.1 LysR family transcriptional regulator [Gordonia amarae]QHN32826.1 LysR family transcriptional regulator [Gordonia amarae]QHN41545.1 LysR family transcriptional regulator [Gordonia amarae]GAB04529.1 putative LysR family transcriptional regulator [Gordonia amarae NBRC 15530]